MNQSTINKIIIVLLVIVIIMLVILFTRNPKQIITVPTSTQSLNQINQLQQDELSLGQQPIIIESPYSYDNGYWLDPNWWWGGSSYVNNNYYYNNTPNHPPVPTHTSSNPTASNPAFTISTMPTNMSMPTLALSVPTIGNISPSANSIFPLPTLASPVMQGQIPIPSIEKISHPQLPVEMPYHKLPAMVKQMQPMVIPDDKAAKVDIQASQIIGMRGGNTNLESAVPQIEPKIHMQH
jgi:hypothetical protein